MRPARSAQLAELTPAQRAYAIKRRKEIWEARNPEQVEQIVPPVEVKKHGHQQDKGFAADTAKVTGQSKQDINRHVARAEALGDILHEYGCRLRSRRPPVLAFETDISVRETELWPVSKPALCVVSAARLSAKVETDQPAREWETRKRTSESRDSK